MLDDKVIVNKAIECEYGILTQICSGEEYDGSMKLEPAELELANAMIRVLSDDKLATELAEKSIERSKTLDIKNAVGSWIQVVCNKK